MRNPPAFQCYASDLLADENFKLASLTERGLAFTMFLQCWVSDSVPADQIELAKVLGLSLGDIEAGLTPRVQRFFEGIGGRLVRRELAEQKAAMMDRRKEQSLGGKKGAKSKWDKAKGRLTIPIATPLATPMASEKRSADMRSGELSPSKAILRKSEEEEILEYQRAFGEARS